MDQIKALSRSSQILLGAGFLLFIFLFFDWQQVSFLGHSVGRSGWAGWGALVGILTIALVGWELVQVLGVKLPELPVKAAMISAGLAAGVLLFTVIKFLVDNAARHWPAWLGLILSIVIAVGGWMRWSGNAPKEIEMKKAPASPPPAPPAS
jgi:hypothetical protein